jgi:hypothetical protein
MKIIAILRSYDSVTAMAASAATTSAEAAT